MLADRPKRRPRALRAQRRTPSLTGLIGAGISVLAFCVRLHVKRKGPVHGPFLRRTVLKTPEIRMCYRRS